MPHLIQAKYMVEFRYPAKAIFHDRRGTIASMFQSDPFTEWQINPIRVVLHSENRVLNAFVTSKNASINSSATNNQEEYLSHLRRYARLIHRQLNLTTLNRMGARMHLLLPQESFDDAARIFTEVIYSDIEEQLSQLGQVYDYSCIWDTNIGERKAHVQIGPMNIEQLLERYIQGEVEKDSFPQTFIFVDFDLYEENPDIRIATDRYIQQFTRQAFDDIVTLTTQLLEGFGLQIGESE
jgi:hypothetical protein